MFCINKTKKDVVRNVMNNNNDTSTRRDIYNQQLDVSIEISSCELFQKKKHEMENFRPIFERNFQNK